ncbi:CaiB/BaiF CoA transferase family protein [Amycolatopsis sp.]|uniref:CaiB/BaiF CoA transferase family protein n=1 Tax=Amycolatopsis sp. TaxID=37632 RepID=UPI002BE054EE|nr:CoA transferase [Amycolatopsis sp.]HVV10518.1 CoA transferase [Amycolatopsis sp.]
MGTAPFDPKDDIDAPLAGLTVIDLSTTLPGAQATQFLADAGADVVLVEPPGGSPLRSLAAWPALARGKRSAVLDLHAEADRATLGGLLRTADVFVTTFRPATLAAWGLTPAALGELNPRLVSAAITGWGRGGPWRDFKGYEALVMAKTGLFHAKRRMGGRRGPTFVSVPYAGWGAAHTALQGILSALLEREKSGHGQHVEADLVRGLSMLDTWSWFTELVGLRWPGAYETVAAFDDEGEPQSPLLYPLLVAPTKDGHWLQFAQTEPRLFKAMLEELGLLHLMAEEKWKGLPVLPTQELRTELWEIMIAKVGERTLAQWQHVFDTNPDVNAEVYRAGPQVFDHPQLVHDGRAVVFADPERGPVRQPSTLVHAQGKPLMPPRPAPGPDEHGPALRALAAQAETVAAEPVAAGGLPLAGVTIVEFGLMFAAPFGSTMLTDLGARVIKVETRHGDTIRNILPFPEAGGARVMQGKESIALDLGTEDGLRIAHELVRRADVVLQAFRAGAAERIGLGERTLRELNPDLVYLSAPGYGTDGPYGHRPAYAPSIGAAAGFALADVPNATQATGSMADIKRASLRLNQAAAVPTVQADGVAALGVASAMLLGLVARARQRPLPPMTTTMLGTATHALVDRVIDYAGRPDSPTVDSEGNGYHALYRLYEASEGWVFLAAPAPKEWPALAEEVDLLGDARFATPEDRKTHDEALSTALAAIFRTRTAEDWEKRLTARDIGCVSVTEQAPELFFQTDAALVAEYTVTAQSPIFEEHRRMGAPVRFSRSATCAKAGCLAGEHTDAILAELGYDEAAVADLKGREIVS